MSLQSMYIAFYNRGKKFTQGLVGILLRDVALSYSGMLITGIIGTIVQSMIIHQLGRDGYGEYILLITALSFIALMLGLGFDTWILKEGAAHVERLADIIWQVLLLKGIGLVIVLIAMSMSLIGQVHYTLAFLFGVGSMACSSFVQTTYAALRVHQRNGRVALYQIIELLLLLAALFATNMAALTVTMLMLIRLVVALLMSAILFKQLRAFGDIIHPHLNLFSALRGAWIYLAAESLSMVYLQMPVLIIGWLIGVSAIGIFRPAIDLIYILYTIPNLAFVIALPLLSRPAIERRSFLKLIHFLLIGSLLFGIAAIVGILVMGQRALHSLTGTGFTESYTYLLLLSPLPLLKALNFVAVGVVIPCNRIPLRIIVQMITASCCIILGFVLIPRYSLYGAAMLIIIIETLLLILYTAIAYIAYRQHRFAEVV